MKRSRGLTFVDIFAGCGGLSLGLMQAGWRGLFAIEADKLAFQTLKHNLIDSQGHCTYDWPRWLTAEPIEISKFIRKHRSHLQALSGQIDLLAGGPPCQGFSFAGRRKKNDPRNELFKHYLEIVGIIRPNLLIFENVKGVTVEFGKKHRSAKRGPGRPPIPFSVKIQNKLDDLGYKVFPLHVRAADFGVPQWRPRYIMVAISRDVLPGDDYDPFRLLQRMQRRFLRDKELPTDRDLMEHCVFCAFLSPGTDATNCGRPCDVHDVKLRDRVGMDHALKADVGCRNTLYNAVPQTTAQYLPQLISRGARHLRIEFLDDAPASVTRIVGLYPDAIAGRRDAKNLWRELKASSQYGVTRGALAIVQ